MDNVYLIEQDGISGFVLTSRAGLNTRPLRSRELLRAMHSTEYVLFMYVQLYSYHCVYCELCACVLCTYLTF